MRTMFVVATLLAASVCAVIGIYFAQSSTTAEVASAQNAADAAIGPVEMADSMPVTAPTAEPRDDDAGGMGASELSSLRSAASKSAGADASAPREPGGMGGMIGGMMGMGDGAAIESAEMAGGGGGDYGPTDEMPGMPRPSEPEDPRSNQRPGAGTLTAGAIDDVAGWREFQEFLQETQQNDPGESYPRMVIGQPFMIRVLDGQRRPLQDARVVVRTAGQTLVDRRTGSDGRLLVTSGVDRLPEQFDVTVTAQKQTVTQPCNRADLLCNVTMPECEGVSPQRLDLALVIDTTGSMGDELAYLKSEIQAIASTVKTMFPNVDQRFALIVYRDNGDQYVTRTLNFTGNLSKFRNAIGNQVASGGGDYPEAMHVAMEQTAQLDWREDDTARMVFLVGDAPPHDEHAERTMQAGRDLQQRGVRIFPVGASGVARKAEFIMRSLAFATQGQYLFLTDHSGVGNAHAAPHVSEYIVEHLDRAMIRMIASELTGKRLAPTEVLAIESGKWSPDWHDEELQFGEVSQTSWQPSPVGPNQPLVSGRCVAARTWWQRSWRTAKENAIWVLIANAGIGLGAVSFFLRQRGGNAKA